MNFLRMLPFDLHLTSRRIRNEKLRDRIRFCHSSYGHDYYGLQLTENIINLATGYRCMLVHQSRWDIIQAKSSRRHGQSRGAFPKFARLSTISTINISGPKLRFRPISFIRLDYYICNNLQTCAQRLCTTWSWTLMYVSLSFTTNI